ncbi:hypothetical protein ACD591_05620 [Rufibacter glacialis]|uniref:Uncharacterized protein n=1 Tax=Rufibacter glacialis TaxID=1259555 RepID=A0A5M8QKL6_9BACT|nr:hypothetical protein [Rufibacter glacialis]KAA6434822.1 hypothetical protein FOE74_11675 [Rufibacter glacialis]GGK72743.1 hypothetical protein GCM10011405_21200 [Rufibacter glacialis]
MTHQDLVPIACKWLLTEASCATVFQGCATGNDPPQDPVVLGVGSFGRSIFIKFFVSRSDFEKETQTQFWQLPVNGVGRYRFLCVPSGLVKEEETPPGWGLLNISEGKQASCILNPYCPTGSEFWRHGFEDFALYDVLRKNDGMASALHRLQFKAVVDLSLE